MNETDDTRRALALKALGLDDAALLQQCTEQFFNAGGPGGQHQNKAETAVRLTHLPTQLVVTASERRSQAQNRSEAVERLRQALARLSHVAAPRVPTRVSRSQKRRRLENKKRHAEKKRARKGDW